MRWCFSVEFTFRQTIRGTQIGPALAFRQLSLDDFRTSMACIYNETLNESMIDEAQIEYKPKDEIIASIADTVRIISVIKPINNFNAAETGSCTFTKQK